MGAVQVTWRRGETSGIRIVLAGYNDRRSTARQIRDPVMADDNTFADFLRRVRAGDEQAAAELVSRYESAVRVEVRMRLADSRLRRVLDSMDLCQSVLASFFVRAAAGQYDLERPEQLVRRAKRTQRRLVYPGSSDGAPTRAAVSPNEPDAARAKRTTARAIGVSATELTLPHVSIISKVVKKARGARRPPAQGSECGSSTQDPARTAGHDGARGPPRSPGDGRGSRRGGRRGPAVRASDHGASLIREGPRVRRPAADECSLDTARLPSRSIPDPLVVAGTAVRGRRRATGRR